MKVLLIVYDEEISFDPTFHSCSRTRDGPMAANLTWETTKVDS